MVEFLNSHKSEIIYAILVLLVVYVLHYANKKLYQWIDKKLSTRREIIEGENFYFAQKVLNVLLIVLGIFALAFIFIDDTKYDIAKGHFYNILYIGLVIVVALIAESLIQAWFKIKVRYKANKGEDTTNFKFLRYIAIFGVYLIAVLLASIKIPFLRGIATTALGGVSIVAIITGVASQEALANVVGGVFIITFKPFKIGDIVKVNDGMIGTVYDITLRHTVIRNYENKMIVIPNSIINKEKLFNYDLGGSKYCQWIDIGISYDSDIDLAKHIIREECEAHPNIYDNRTELDKYNHVNKVKVRVIDLGDSAVTIRAWAWAADYNDAFEMKCDLYEGIKKRFDKEGISIPFPHRTLVFQDEQMKKFLSKQSAEQNSES